MKTTESSITVNVPVNRAYNQWTQFEEFHLFMEGVKEVTQLDDKRLHWKAEIAGKIKVPMSESSGAAPVGQKLPARLISLRSAPARPK